MELAFLAFGIVGLVLLGYVYLVSGLIVPVPYLYVLWGVWGALVVVAIWLRRRPPLVALVPVAGLLLWVIVAFGLGALLDWTA
jgi:hypothetical protein